MLDVLFGISPIFAGVVMGLIRPASILVGMHHAMTPIALENFATKGYDMLMPMMFIANLSIVGAAAGCYFKEKSQKERSIVLSSVLSGILGITEPALFGVLTKYKKGFLAATIGSCVAAPSSVPLVCACTAISPPAFSAFPLISDLTSSTPPSAGSLPLAYPLF